MERAHRIGQTKPVTVYRLVSRGSVEERMLARAGKKLYLNAMVGEMDSGQNSKKASADEGDGASPAAGLSKAELASLIRYGANAVMEGSDNGTEMTDSELDVMIGRGASESSLAVQESAEEQQARQAEQLLSRLRPLAELDLRQFQDVVYTKKKASSAAELLAEEQFALQLDTKRVRKGRVVMVDGRGSGYGGDIPVLMDYLEPAEPVSKPLTLKRQREWTHIDFCALCGLMDRTTTPAKAKKGKPKKEPSLQSAPTEPLVLCSYCPWSFHSSCMAEVHMHRSNKTFSCPHHCCSSCRRSTASAGGLLFRCSDCLTAYCEDCLPQEDVEGDGRNEFLELQAYISKQAFFILCNGCKSPPPAVEPATAMTRDSEDGDGGGDDDGDEPPLLPTQRMKLASDKLSSLVAKAKRLQKKEASRQGKNGPAFRKGTRKSIRSADADSVTVMKPESQKDNAELVRPSKAAIKAFEKESLPAQVPLTSAVDVLTRHPLGAMALASSAEMSGSLSLVLEKAKLGMYSTVVYYCIVRFKNYFSY